MTMSEQGFLGFEVLGVVLVLNSLFLLTSYAKKSYDREHNLK